MCLNFMKKIMQTFSLVFLFFFFNFELFKTKKIFQKIRKI
jgi:hypothetical protein